LLAALLLIATAGAARREDFRGFNIVATPGHPFGGASAKRALDDAKRLGATAVAIIPLLWQPSPSNPAIVRGTDLQSFSPGLPTQASTECDASAVVQRIRKRFGHSRTLRCRVFRQCASGGDQEPAEKNVQCGVIGIEAGKREIDRQGRQYSHHRNAPGDDEQSYVGRARHGILLMCCSECKHAR
jgi:hypothetical protein